MKQVYKFEEGVKIIGDENTKIKQKIRMIRSIPLGLTAPSRVPGRLNPIGRRDCE